MDRRRGTDQISFVEKHSLFLSVGEIAQLLVREYSSERNSQSVGNTIKHEDGDVSSPAFDVADVASIHTGSGS